MKTLPIIEKTKAPEKRGEYKEQNGRTRVQEDKMKTNDPPKRGDPKGNVKLHVYYIGTAM